MDKKNHYKKQRKYFDKEFSLRKTYLLEPWQESYIDRIKKSMLGKAFKEKKLLDIATGSGYIAIEMAKLGLQVTACDLSSQAIKNLEKYKRQFNLKNLKLIVCKAEELPFKNQTFDYITANAILEHIPEEQRAIDEWKRVLKKKGKMFIAVPLKLRYIWPFLWLPNMIHDKRIGHLRRYDLPTLKKKFNLIIKKYFYTGHLIKVYPIIVSKLVKISTLDIFAEKIDRQQEHLRYGANNILVIFENEK